MNLAVLLGLGVVGYFVFDSMSRSGASTASAGNEQPGGGTVMSVAYAPPILLASVNGITFSASWSVPDGNPVAYWVFAFASDLNFQQNYVEVKFPLNQLSVSNDKASASYYFRVKFVDENGVSSPWSNFVGPLTSASQQTPVVIGSAAPVVSAPASSTSTASNAPIEVPVIPEVYEASGSTSIADSGVSAAEQAAEEQNVADLVASYSAELGTVVGQPQAFLVMVQQLFGGNPALLDSVSADIKSYFNQLVSAGPGGNLSVWDLASYYQAVEQYGNASFAGIQSGLQVFKQWQADGVLPKLTLNADEYLVPASILA